MAEIDWEQRALTMQKVARRHIERANLLRADLESTWEALGYVTEWTYPGTSDDVLVAVANVAALEFQKVSTRLGWSCDYPFGRGGQDES